MSHFRRIICASDFSSASRRAFMTAVRMAKANRAALTIAHVIAPVGPLVPEQYIDSATLDKVNAQARGWGNRQLAKLAARAKTGGVRATSLLLEGDPAQQIVRAARARRADLIVIGTHGRRGLSKFFLGSVAERVVATARCPVVTVRGK